MDENIDLSKNTEINEALKEFEEKSGAEQIQKVPEAPKDFEPPKIVQWVMKLFGGAIKDERQAEYVLLGFVIVAIGISLYLFFGSGNKQPKIPAEVLEQMKLMPINR